MVLLIDALADSAKIPMAATRPTPIISAAAVVDVRLGLRSAFSWASSPGTPPILAIGAPTSRLKGIAMNGLRALTARNTSAAAMPMTSARLEGEPNRPHHSSERPTTAVARPAARRRRVSPDSLTAAARMAAIGAMLPARHDGTIAEITVTPIPTIRP